MINIKIEEIVSDNVSFYDIADSFCERPHFVFLDSRTNGNSTGKHSFLSFDPFLVLKSKGNKISIIQGDGREKKIEGNPLDHINNILLKYKINSSVGKEISPFLGGGIGYFSYELGRQMEVLPATAKDDMGLPECYICFYNFVVILNNEKKKIFISCFDPKIKCEFTSIRQITEEIKLIHGRGGDSEISPSQRKKSVGATNECKSNFNKREYLNAVNRVKEHIFQGDVCQVNLSQRFQMDINNIKPWNLYKRLMDINPAPFACYLNFEDVCVASASPERFIKVVGNDVETRPIKGTIKRGVNPREDKINKELLWNSVKDRSELLMIVDLLRNDLGRVCKTGSVKVEAFPELETYASLHHLVATITGVLPDDKNIIDLLKASFPGGSVTGAPKIKAMEIIDELEPVERGIYTGSIGYLGFNGNSDLNIVIRTIVMRDQKAYIQVGGGIVPDSVDMEEYKETLLKARNLIEVIFADQNNCK